MTDLPDRAMKGGEKRKWLRLHYDEIMAYYQDNGEAATREKYNIRRDIAWDHFIGGEKPQMPKFSKSDRAIELAKIAIESNRELKGEIVGMRRDFRLFCETVGEDVKKGLIIPLLRAQIKLPPELEEKMTDPLSLNNFNGRLLKRG